MTLGQIMSRPSGRERLAITVGYFVLAEDTKVQ